MHFLPPSAFRLQPLSPCVHNLTPGDVEYRHMDVIYLDNNATTRPDPDVVEAMLPYLGDYYGNPSSVHRLGQQARHVIEDSRQRVAALIGATEAEVYFTGGGTESVNTAVRGIFAARSPRRQLVTSTVEHSATREVCKHLGRGGSDVVSIGVNSQGELDLAALEESVTAETALVTLIWANNETGVVFPIEAIAALCREKRVPLHIDGTQAVGKIPIDVKKVGIDAMSFAPHKFHGPKGVGCLFVRKGVRFAPLLIGGPQEKDRRGGTENVPGIVGTAEAAELAGKHLGDMPAVAALRDRLENGILGSIQETRVNGRRDARIANTTNISFYRLEAEAILLLLSEQGVCASAGSACSSGSLEPSPVILAMGIPDVWAHGAVRFSLSRFTTEHEIDRVLEILPPVIDRLRRAMPPGE